jgi:hypothetical protein
MVDLDGRENPVDSYDTPVRRDLDVIRSFVPLTVTESAAPSPALPPIAPAEVE